MVVRVNEWPTRLIAERTCRVDAVAERLAVKPHVSAVAASGRDLGQGRALWHEDSDLDAEHLGSERDPLGMVPGARGHYPEVLLIVAQSCQPGVGASNLERPRALQVLALQPHRATTALSQGPKPGEGRMSDHISDELARRQHVGQVNWKSGHVDILAGCPCKSQGTPVSTVGNQRPGVPNATTAAENPCK